MVKRPLNYLADTKVFIGGQESHVGSTYGYDPAPKAKHKCCVMDSLLGEQQNSYQSALVVHQNYIMHSATSAFSYVYTIGNEFVKNTIGMKNIKVST